MTHYRQHMAAGNGPPWVEGMTSVMLAGITADTGTHRNDRDAEVETMADSERPTESLGDPTLPTVEAPEAGESWKRHTPLSAGDRVGHFAIRQVLGEGGFGVVYQAEQTEPVRRMVALKVIKPGMDSKAVVTRFEAERQALALMDHPCVAKVFDGGVTEAGLPYFAMELVKGLPITEHCDRHKLSLEERLQLFMRVCEAVQHAHGKGVIHRDLKPSNVLVSYADSEHTPKVIDFGIAKALSQKLSEATIFTQHGQMIGTPEYMSPEQAEMGVQDIDTRSDVYSLGVILYELLTGQRPFDSTTLRSAALREIQRIIREVDPPKPSTRVASGGDAETATKVAESRRVELRTLTGALRRDLDWVVMKCLEKDRSRRYETANALTMEIERYLKSEPVLAGPPTVSYRLGKFVKRNRAGVVAASIGALLLVGGLGGTSYGLIEASRQAKLASDAADAESERADEAEAAMKRAEAAEEEAEARANELQLVADFQSKQLGAIEIEQMGAQLREAIIEGAPESTRAALREALEGVNFTDIALGTLRANIFEQTIDAIDTQFVDQPIVRAQLLQSTANTLQTLGIFDFARDPQERALAIRRLEFGDGHINTLKSMNNLAVLYDNLGELGNAERTYLEVLEIQRSELGVEHQETLGTMTNLVGLYHVQGRFAEAEEIAVQALEAQERTLGEEHSDVLLTRSNLAVIYKSQAKYSAAEQMYVETLEVMRRSWSEDDPNLLVFKTNLAALYRDQGKYSEAEELLLETLESLRRVLGEDHLATLRAMGSLAIVYSDQVQYDKAEKMYRRTLDIERRVLGQDHPSTLGTTTNLGFTYVSMSRFEDAAAMFETSLPIKRRVLGLDHPWTLFAMEGLAGAYLSLGRRDEALALSEELLELRITDAEMPEADPQTLDHAARLLLTHEIEELRDVERALDYARRACDLDEASGGGNLAQYLDTRARAENDSGDPASAFGTQREALSRLPVDHPDRREYQARLDDYAAALSTGG